MESELQRERVAAQRQRVQVCKQTRLCLRLFTQGPQHTFLANENFLFILTLEPTNQPLHNDDVVIKWNYMVCKRRCTGRFAHAKMVVINYAVLSNCMCLLPSLISALLPPTSSLPSPSLPPPPSLPLPHSLPPFPPHLPSLTSWS